MSKRVLGKRCPTCGVVLVRGRSATVYERPGYASVMVVCWRCSRRRREAWKAQQPKRAPRKRGRPTAAEAVALSFIPTFKTEHAATIYRDGEVYRVRVVDSPRTGRKLVRI